MRVCEGIEIDDGTLSLGVLKRAAQRDMPTLIPRLFSEQRPAARHRQIEHFDDVTAATVSSISETKDGATRPFPVQVDGDYIGETDRGRAAVAPGALTIVASDAQARRRYPVGVEDRLDVAQAGDALLQLLGVADLDHEAVLDHRVLGRAAGPEDVDPGLREGAREVLEQAGAVVGVDLELDPVGGLVVARPS